MQVVIPGLDHSLVEEGGRLFWEADRNFVQPPRRKNVKSKKSKNQPGLNGWVTPAQKAIW